MLLLIISLAILAIIWYVSRRRSMSILARNGIPGPKPHIIFGNLREYNSKGYAKCDEEWIKDYGNIVGYYLGGKPFILITDPQLLKRIQIEDFKNFTKKPATRENPNPIFQQNIIRVNNNRWKTMRKLMSPTFSKAKLRYDSHIQHKY